MKNIAIRADGSENIGMGHIMRCISLAKELDLIGCEVVFFSKYACGIKKVLENGFDVEVLESKLKSKEGFEYGDLEEIEAENAQLSQKLLKGKFDMLILDSYNVNKEYMQALGRLTKLVYIDDINRFSYPADILINGNIGAEKLDYKKHPKTKVMLLGSKYNLLRREFSNISSRKIKKEVREVMVTMGGSDPCEFTKQAVEGLVESGLLDKLVLNVVLGAGFSDKEWFRRLAKNIDSFRIYENIDNISEIMLKSDIAFSAGGSTLYELCACGTPTIAFIMAQNQELIVKNLEQKGCTINMGWYNKVSKGEIGDALEKLCGNFEIRKSLSARARDVVDGKGTGRVAKILNDFLSGRGEN